MFSGCLSIHSLVLEIVISLVVCSICLLVFYQPRSDDPREPVLLHPKIPIIGHILSLFLHGSGYYEKLRTKNQLPIYRLELLGHTIYVVNSPELASAVDRNATAFPFAPYLVQFAKRALHPTEDGVKKLAENLEGKDSKLGLRIETQRAMHESMAAGSGSLKSLNSAFLHELANVVNMQYLPTGSPVALFDLIRKTVTKASTTAVYGPGNPFSQTEVADGLWSFEKDLGLIALDWIPEIIAPRGYHGRQAVVNGFIDYFQNQLQEEGSVLVKARHKANIEYDVCLEDQARFEASSAFALLMNTVPAIFWTLFHVFSDPLLLMELRKQLEPFICSVSNASDDNAEETDTKAFSIDMAQIERECPLLKATVQEVLRIRSTNASGRMVVRDTMLDGQYLLKANSTILTPAASIHRNTSVWDVTAPLFNPYRFMKDEKSQKRLQPAYSYRAFGGGVALCPGRSFAYMEILSVVAVMLLRYDIVPVDSRGHVSRWYEPVSQPHILTSVLSPKKDIKVMIINRTEFRDSKWHLTLGHDGDL